MSKLPILFIPDKQKAGMENQRIAVAFKEIERWANNANIASGGYASLTGPGQTTTPGDLTQAGGFAVNDTGATGIALHTFGGGNITLQAGTGGELILNSAPGSGPQVELSASGNNGVLITGRSDGTIPGVHISEEGGFLAEDFGVGGQIEITTTGGINLYAAGTATGNITLTRNHLSANIILANLPTTAPSVTGALWNSSGVVHIV